MHDWMDKRLKWVAIPRFPLILVIGQSIFFLISLGQPQVIAEMWLTWREVLAGDVWRPITFLIMPPTISPSGFMRGVGTVFAFFAIYLVWLTGSGLEAAWGTTRMTVYILIGWGLAMVAAAVDPGWPATNALINLSIFLAFAWLYPDYIFHVFFILPVKVKWLALLSWAALTLTFVTALAAGHWQVAAVTAAGVANFFIFLGPKVWARVVGGVRHAEKRRQALIDQAKPMHTCCVSGWTERTHPEAEFRYVKEDGEVKCYAMEYLPDKYKQAAE